MAKAVYFETDTEGDPLAFREMIDRLGKFVRRTGLPTI